MAAFQGLSLHIPKPEDSGGMLSNPGSGQVLTQDGAYVDGDFYITEVGVRNMSGGAQFWVPRPISVTSMSELLEIAVVGRGGNAVVRKVLHLPTKKEMAVKAIPVSAPSADNARSQVVMELNTLYSSQSPHIVNFYGAFHDNGRVVLVLEYMDGGSLKDILQHCGCISEPVLRAITHRLLLGFQYLHTERRIIHRDVKPSNILVNTRGEVKLADFGVSGQLAHTLAVANTRVGTLSYMSPERIRSRPHDTSSDLWSLGLTLMELATGKYPYHDDAGRAEFWTLMNLIVKSDPPQLDPDEFSPEMCDFVALCMSKDPADRPGVLQLLWHPWIKGKPEDEDVMSPVLSSLAEYREKLDSGLLLEGYTHAAKTDMRVGEHSSMLAEWVQSTDPLLREATIIEKSTRKEMIRRLARAGDKEAGHPASSRGIATASSVSGFSAGASTGGFSAGAVSGTRRGTSQYFL